ncbi:hypothetical protein ACH5RR_000692, partial [Cinchona calisaya]
MCTLKGDEIFVEEKSSARIFILNRLKQLTEFNFPMFESCLSVRSPFIWTLQDDYLALEIQISRLLDLFLDSEKDPNVKLIVLKELLLSLPNTS